MCVSVLHAIADPKRVHTHAQTQDLPLTFYALCARASAIAFPVFTLSVRSDSDDDDDVGTDMSVCRDCALEMAHRGTAAD